MPGIGDTLKAERRRQGRTLADAAAETRIRESYLAAIEEDDFDVLGGDVYARGFIRLYGKYLGIDAEALVADFRANHERPAEVTTIPGADYDEVRQPLTGVARMAATPPVYAAVGLVVVLVAIVVAVRTGGDDDVELDPNAAGPSPAAAGADADQDGAADDPAQDTAEGDTTEDTDEGASVDPDDAAPAVGDTAVPDAETAPEGTGEGLGEDGTIQQIQIVVTAVEPVQLTVDRGSPPVSGATLQAGESRTLTDPQGTEVSFTLSDFGAAEVRLNGDALLDERLVGERVRITCTVGRPACDAVIL